MYRLRLLSRRVMLACVVACGLPIAAVSAQRTVLLHGAISSGARWNSVVSQLQQTYPGIDTRNPDIYQGTTLDQQANGVAYLMNGPSTILVGHSNGGLVARYLRAYYGPAHGVVTVGTPHRGVPFASSTRQTTFVALGATAVAAAADLAILPQLDAYMLDGGSFAWTLATFAVTTYAAMEGTANALFAFVDKFAAFAAQDLPGSTFLTQTLPVAGPNSYAIYVTLDPAAAVGGPAALITSGTLAAQIGANIVAGGAALEFYGYEVSQDIDWGLPDADLAALLVGSAWTLGTIALTWPEEWCILVSPSGYSCEESDGFVPTAYQQLAGAFNFPMAGPSHTAEPDDLFIVPAIVRFVGQIRDAP